MEALNTHPSLRCIRNVALKTLSARSADFVSATAACVLPFSCKLEWVQTGSMSAIHQRLSVKNAIGMRIYP